MYYIQPLSQYNFDLKAKKLEGLARLAKLGLPTVSNLFVVSPKAYKVFYKTHKLGDDLKYELGKIFQSIRSQGESVTLRNAIYERNNPAVAFSVSNSPNLKTYQEFEKRIVAGYRKAMRTSFDPANLEFSYLIQSFYSSEKCGTLLTTSNRTQILLHAILGQHTNLLFRGDIEPDSYVIQKSTYKILDKHIAEKQYRFKKQRSGLTKVRVNKDEQYQPVLTDEQVVRIAKLAIRAEKTYGPQQIDWAILDSGKIIFQETHNLEKPNNIRFAEQGEIIYPSEVSGEVVNVHAIPDKGLETLKDKIVITDNLDIQFINKLLFVCHPKAVILTKGSLTSHAATILREAKMTTILIRGVNLPDQDKVKITKRGEIVHE